ncbi:hypothetical protein MTO96_024293 [Rhipicephalus appendiculatus]
MNPTWQVGRSAVEAAASSARTSVRRSHTRTRKSSRCSAGCFVVAALFPAAFRRGDNSAEVTGKGYDRTTTTRRRVPAVTFGGFALPGDCDGATGR